MTTTKQTKTTWTINICADYVWVGTGKYSDGYISDCGAVLGADQDASDDAYDAIQDAIVDTMDETDTPDESGTVTHDGVLYGWTLGDAR